MTAWIDRSAVLGRLGIRAQTLYAYVSRGRIGVRSDPEDARRSLYNAEDVAMLAARRKRGRAAPAIAASALSWGEAAIVTAISTVDHGRLIYRGSDAVLLAEHATLEHVAGLLWQQDVPPKFSGQRGATGQGDPFAALAGLVSGARAGLGRSADALRRDAVDAIGCLMGGFGLASDDRPLHLRLAEAWSVDRTGADLLRRALVLLADHELNASTFAVRVASSTGASIAACLLAGLATLSGPRHGGAGVAVAILVADAERSGAQRALDHWLALGHAPPGFGHPLYPQGDARGRALLDRLAIDPVMTALHEAVLSATGRLPNVDFALAAMTRQLALPADAPFTLFALSRSIGWVAHALEQAHGDRIIRPRARYEGAMPKGG